MALKRRTLRRPVAHSPTSNSLLHRRFGGQALALPFTLRGTYRRISLARRVFAPPPHHAPRPLRTIPHTPTTYCPLPPPFCRYPTAFKVCGRTALAWMFPAPTLPGSVCLRKTTRRPHQRGRADVFCAPAPFACPLFAYEHYLLPPVTTRFTCRVPAYVRSPAGLLFYPRCLMPHCPLPLPPPPPTVYPTPHILLADCSSPLFSGLLYLLVPLLPTWTIVCTRLLCF